MTTTPKPTPNLSSLDERRDELADEYLMGFSDYAREDQDIYFRDGWDACRAELQAEHKEHMREQFAELVKRQRDLQEENQKLREALEGLLKAYDDVCENDDGAVLVQWRKELEEIARKALEEK